MDLSTIASNDAVFINCPFDDDYQPLLRAVIFTVYRCGFLPVTALGEDNGLDNRLLKIEHCIQACRYGIHDISRTELNDNDLPRFNMPFELGIFFGAKYFGDKNQKNKNAVIFDKDRYRYLEFISDLNGVDIKAHNNDVNIIIRKIRDWLSTSSRRKTIPGHAIIQRQFAEFTAALPGIANDLGLDVDDIPFSDFCVIVEETVRKFIE
jgi:hypothetical protein